MAESPKPGQRIAYFGRVSTPKQKLEHQRDDVDRWAERHGIYIPTHLKFEDKIRRHQAAGMFRDWDKRKAKQVRERYRFDDLMSLVEDGKLDWIVIATFDRWGIQDRDEIFTFRSRLRQMGVKLYSIADQLDITGTDDGNFFEVAVKALSANGYVIQQAEKNIQKMISMAEGGWHASGNVPFSLDLVLYPLHDLTRPLWRVVRTKFKPAAFRILTYSESSRVERDANGLITAWHAETTRVELSERMPLRDKKTTGYRLEPSEDPAQLNAVRLTFDLADQGHTFGSIVDTLFDRGFRHYGKRFGTHAIETILTNPAFIGRPAWGKNATGMYRRAYGKQPKRVDKRTTNCVVEKKPKADWVFPTHPVFPPIVDSALFERVNAKLEAAREANPSCGKTRTRNRATHSLNGKLFCPDCNAPMVLGSFMPGSKTRGKRFHCFHCGTWRKTNRTECSANTVRWELLDAATVQLLKTVGDRIDSVERTEFSSAQCAEWMLRAEVGRLMLWMYWALVGETGINGPEGKAPACLPKLWEEFGHYLKESITTPGESGIAVIHPAQIPAAFFSFCLAGDASALEDEEKTTRYLRLISERYNERHAKQCAAAEAELAEVSREITDIALVLPKQVRNPTAYEALNNRLSELEAKKLEMESRFRPLSLRAERIQAALRRVKETISQAERLKVAGLLDTFIERVEPIFEVQAVGAAKKRRTKVIGFRFIPKASPTSIVIEEMEVLLTRTGTGSSRRTGRSLPGT